MGSHRAIGRMRGSVGAWVLDRACRQVRMWRDKLGPARAGSLFVCVNASARELLDAADESADHVTGPWRYERIEGAGHWLQLDAPTQVSTLLLEFLV